MHTVMYRANFATEAKSSRSNEQRKEDARYKGAAIRAAKELGYNEAVINRLKELTDPNTISRVMHDAREKWEVE